MYGLWWDIVYAICVIVFICIIGGIVRSMDRHEAWLNRQPLRAEARKRFDEVMKEVN